MPGIELTVLHDFGQYVRGMFITAEEEIQAVLKGEHANRVTKVAAGTYKAFETAVAKVEAVAAEVVAAPAKVESAAKAAVADVKAAAATSTDSAKA